MIQRLPIFLIHAQVVRMPRIVLRMGIFILTIAISTNTLAALPLEQTITSTLTALFVNSGAPGMVIAAVRVDMLLIQGYGETQKGNPQQPDASSLVRVGSIAGCHQLGQEL